MVRSWRRPITAISGPAKRAGPVSVTVQSQEKRVPAGVGSHWMWPCTVAPAMTLRESMRCGRSKLRVLDRDRSWGATSHDGGLEPGADSDRARGQLGRRGHGGVVARLVALVGHDVEDHLDRAGDVQAAPDPAHEVALSGRGGAASSRPARTRSAGAARRACSPGRSSDAAPRPRSLPPRRPPRRCRRPVRRTTPCA